MYNIDFDVVRERGNEFSPLTGDLQIPHQNPQGMMQLPVLNLCLSSGLMYMLCHIIALFSIF